MPNMIPLNIIANADDFGFNKNITDGIVRAYERGYVNSLSLMTNGNYFEEAVSIIKSRPLLKNVGVHINFTLGKPLTAINKMYLTHTGEWDRTNVDKVFMVLSKQSSEAFYKEICCQIERALNAGIDINHLDSHHHVHTLPCFVRLFIKAARSYDLKLRLAQTSPSGNIFKNLYRQQLNKAIISNELNYSSYFEHPGKIKQRIAGLNGMKTIEVMLHPILNELGELTDHHDPIGFNQWMQSFTSPLSENMLAMKSDTIPNYSVSGI